MSSFQQKIITRHAKRQNKYTNNNKNKQSLQRKNNHYTQTCILEMLELSDRNEYTVISALRAVMENSRQHARTDG